MPERNKKLIYEACSTKRAYAVILAGGKGKRLQPISTESRPKAFLPVTRDDKTMFKITLDRVKKLFPPEHIIVVANKRNARLVKKDFPGISTKNLILEPLSRNTASAVALTASILRNRAGDTIMVVLPADHYIVGDEPYLASIRKAIDFVNRHAADDPLVVFGLIPRFPANSFGYIKIKCRVEDEESADIYKVEKFLEKPNLETAERFIQNERYLWNSGMFVFKASSILTAIEEFMPKISEELRLLDKTKLDVIYKRLPDISIDYAVMEHARTIYCVKGKYGWNDIGNFKALRQVLEKELSSLIKSSTKSRRAVKKPLSMQILAKLQEVCGHET